MTLRTSLPSAYIIKTAFLVCWARATSAPLSPERKARQSAIGPNSNGVLFDGVLLDGGLEIRALQAGDVVALVRLDNRVVQIDHHQQLIERHGLD